MDDDVKAQTGRLGLRYVTDRSPGIRRGGAPGNFHYIDAAGRRIGDPQTLERIARLVLPPAWTDVWIAPCERAYLQATGRDARRRKQYRYHARWRAYREESKFARMLDFGAALPAIRARVEHDLARPGLSREKILATVLRLLEITLIRVGNEEYARANHSYGLTTLRNRHVNVSGTELMFEFRGKSGKTHCVRLKDRRLAAIVKRCKELPGAELFQYVDENGERRSIGSQDVNEYLREITAGDFTAKDFRTWGGSVCALDALFAEIGDSACAQSASTPSEKQARRTVNHIVSQVAKRLGNTPAVCRKHYIHPRVIEACLDVHGLLARNAESPLRREVAVAEATLMRLLHEETSTLKSRAARAGRS